MSLRPPRDLYAYRGHKQTVAPAVEPVTAAELRTLLRESVAGLPDSEAADYIAEAREMVEENTGLALINQTWILVFDRWPGRSADDWWDGIIQGSIAELQSCDGHVTLPRYPLSSVTGISVYDEASNSTAVDVAATFDVDTYRKPGRIGLKSGKTWPIETRPTNGVEITYVAGYGASADDVPAALKRAVKQAAAYLYTHRGDDCCNVDAVASVAGMLNQFRVARI